MMIIAWAIIHT